MSWRSLAFKTVSLPVLIAVVGTALSAGLAWRAQVGARAQADGEFDRLTAQVMQEIELRFAQPLYGLRGARGTYAARREIRRGEFGAYVASLGMASEFQGVRGFGFIQHTQKTDDSDVVAAERTDEAPGFAIRELGPTAHEDRYVVIHIEPLARNAPEVGLDVGSEGIRRQAIERSISTGEAVLTPPLVLDPDG
ncbi:MAG: CHASE domain-containing protein, partial [Rubrivivax sp.]